MLPPFEDPRKTRLRHQSLQAIDAAGFEVIEPPKRIELPLETGLQGGIAPDAQSVGADGFRYNYYIRPGAAGSKAVPQWIVSLARAAHQLDRVLVYLIVEESGPTLEESCRSVGAGLLVLRDDLRFDNVVDPRAVSPSNISGRITERLKAVRRKLETKLDMNLNNAQAYYDDVRTAMSVENRGQYLEVAEQMSLRWREWADLLSARLDEVGSNGDETELNAIEAEIEAGPK